jgi:hypothetical protein
MHVRKGTVAMRRRTVKGFAAHSAERAVFCAEPRILLGELPEHGRLGQDRRIGAREHR